MWIYVDNIGFLVDHFQRIFSPGLRLLIFLPLILLSFYASAQVTVTAATGGESMCLNAGPTDSDFYNLSPIVITENNNDDINNLNNANEFIVLQFSGGHSSLTLVLVLLRFRLRAAM